MKVAAPVAKVATPEHHPAEVAGPEPLTQAVAQKKTEVTKTKKHHKKNNKDRQIALLKLEVENERKLRHNLEQEAAKSLELALSEQQQELDDSIAAEKQEIKS